MSAHPPGPFDYDERGSGPTLVLVPGSWSTGSAWRSVVASLSESYRVVTTSLPGYGGTAERRRDDDRSLARVAESVEAVVERAGGPVHLVGHSFGGLACLAVAQRERVDVRSLTILEATAFDALRRAHEDDLFAAVVRMVDAYRKDFEAGDDEAARRVLDFYGGAGSFDGFPPRLRDYIVETTATNVLDWASVFGDRGDLADYERITVPTTVVRGELGHACVARAAEIVATSLGQGELATIGGASHFMLTTHPTEVASLVEQRVARAAT